MPESLRPTYDEMVAEMDRETLKAMVEVARTEKSSYGFRFANKLVNTMVNKIHASRMVKDINKRFEDIIEVRSVSASRRGDETQLNVDCVLSRPVEYVYMTVHV